MEKGKRHLWWEILILLGAGSSFPWPEGAKKPSSYLRYILPNIEVELFRLEKIS